MKLNKVIISGSSLLFVCILFGGISVFFQEQTFFGAEILAIVFLIAPYYFVPKLFNLTKQETVITTIIAMVAQVTLVTTLIVSNLWM